MKTKPLIFIFAFIISSIFIIPGVFAQLGIPNQFWGDVSYNGASAPDGLTIEAKIDGITVKETSVLAGRYGYDPLFFVTDPDEGREGKIIVFYINNIEASSSIFGNGKTTELSLAVNGPVIGGSSPPSSSPRGGGGGPSGSSTTPSSSSISPTFLSDSTEDTTQEDFQELNIDETPEKTEETTVKSRLGMAPLALALLMIIIVGIVFLRNGTFDKIKNSKKFKSFFLHNKK